MVQELLDPELRLSPAATRLAEAAISVIADDGYEALSVRTVAAEAGLSIGAVQHHFSTRNDLLVGALKQTLASISDRLTSKLDANDIEGLVGLLEEALPLDEQRRREVLVWIELSAAAAYRPDLASWHGRFVDMLVDQVAAVLDRSHPTSHETSTSTARAIAALVDGIALHGVAGTLPTKEQRQILRSTLHCLVDGTSHEVAAS